MRQATSLIGLVLCLSVWSVDRSDAAEPVPPASGTLVRDNTAFAVDLYRQLSSREGNLFLSPYSISTALAMTYAGARGDTEEQMERTLHFALGQDGLHPAFAELAARVAAVQEAGHVQLSIANSLWPQAGHDFLPAYLDLRRQHYGVTITPVDYTRAAEQARVTINKWVEAQTQNRIRDILATGTVDELTRLILVNAIYFKGSWLSRFDADATETAPFHVSKALSVEAPLMTQRETFHYAEDDDTQVLELSYEGEALSMLVLLPKARDGLPALEEKLSAKGIAAWRSKLVNREVIVHIPRFKLTSQFSLGNTLQAMGMRDAFSEAKANFAGMDGRRDWLYIGAVLHKAFVEVNEEGTEAAAATAVIMQARSMPAPPPEFRADHPFVFLIQDRRNGSVLFMGRVADPTKE